MPKTTSKVTFDSTDEIVQDPFKLREALDNPSISHNTNIPIDTAIEAVYQNPFTVSGDNTEHPERGIVNIPLGKVAGEEKAGFFESAEAEFKNLSTNYKSLDAASGYMQQSSFIASDTPSNWTPTLNPSDLVDLPDHLAAYVMQAKNPQDLAYRRSWALEQVHNEETLNNGSFFGKLVGGFLGGFTPIGSIENLIPLAGFVKYSKVGSTGLKTMMKMAPSLTAAAAIRSGAEQVDKVGGNLQDFVIGTFVDAIVSTSLFGAAGAVATGFDKIQLQKLSEYGKKYIKGIDFNWKIDKSGVVKGFEAKARDNTVSAAQVSFAQEMADSSFYKGGIFKIPYVGDATLRILSGQAPWSDDMPMLGALNPTIRFLASSPLIQGLTSPYNSVKAFFDTHFDHYITTEGTAKGGTQAFSHEHYMKQERAQLKSMFVQVDALHIERNGLNAPPRPLRGLWNAGLAFRNKTLEQVGKDLEPNNYISKDDFLDEVQNALWSGESSEHSAVNEAAAMFRKKIDKTWLDFRKAYNLPDDWLPSRTAESYLMRVYNTAYLNTADGEREWTNVISQYLKDADENILAKMKPINDAQLELDDATRIHNELVRTSKVPTPTDAELAKEEELRNVVRPIKEKLSKAKSSLKTAKREATKEKHQKNIDEITNELAPHQEALDSHLMKIYSADITLKNSSNNLEWLKGKKRSFEESLQNELRSNPDLSLHVDDINALSANESKQLKNTLKPLNEAKLDLENHKSIITDVKVQISRAEQAAKKGKTVETAQKHQETSDALRLELDKHETTLRTLEDKVYTLEEDLQDSIRSGQLNPRFYKKVPGSERYELADPSNRLKFRKTHESDYHRAEAARGYYQSIMHMTPEDIIADTMGKITGNASENVLKSRSLMIPDSVLYKNNFMTKDLKAKTANYVNYLARRTHLKTVNKDITLDGGFDEIAKEFLKEHEFKRSLIQTRIDKLNESIKAENEIETKTPGKLESLNADLKETKKDFSREVRDFDTAKTLLKRAYTTRVMGIQNREGWEPVARRVFMSIMAATNLHNLPATQITDIAGAAFQHGLMAFVRDGLYPVIQSIGGILKTKDSEALRKVAGNVHLGLNDYLMGVSEKQWGQELQPYLNMGKIVSGIEKYAQFSANADVSTYIDNGVQHFSGAIVQGEFMRILHAFKEGKMTEKEGLYLRKYGIDPAKWADRMVESFNEAGGYKTAVGGFQSMFWKWQDLEASDLFSNAVFKGINNTLIMRGTADSPFVADNLLGMMFHTFTGWGYASVNRYLIPALQHPDAALVARTVMMLAAGSLVSPMRRLARGEDMYPDNMTDEQFAYEAINDSGVFSNFANGLNYVNMLSDDRLMGDLKNDKYRNRIRVGLGTTGGATVNRMMDVLSMVASGNYNEKDIKTLAHMTAISGSMYGRYVSDKIIEGLGVPKTASQARSNRELN